MTPERAQQLQQIFSAALLLPTEEQTGYVKSAAANDEELLREVRSLLDAHERADHEGFMESPAARLPDLLRENTLQRRHLGPYVLVRKIGGGGMGEVYLAFREHPFRQQVALKLARPGMESDDLQRRFEIERQILASLNHPNIARLLDGGMSEDGLAYLVMEHVEGKPITAYCDERRLSIDARLELFGQVCQAVQYAHQNLIVHRDLKPSNILVDRFGTVKLLDFGVAKLLNPTLANVDMPVTRTDHRVMTPEYAAPEQVRGEAITTATDIYALGVLLYELLTGHRPYRLANASPLELEHAICERQPPLPSTRITRTEVFVRPDGAEETITAHEVSTARNASPERLKRELRGDLDTIVLMALRKEPHLRYASAEQFGADIRRYLSGRPVTARRDTRFYRVRKFVRRHRTGVGAGALFLLLLIAVSIVAIRQSVMLQLRSDEAELEAENARAVSAFLIDLFNVRNPYLAGELDTLRVGDFVEVNTLRLQRELQDQPILKARLLRVLGEVNNNLTRYDEAETLIEEALSLQRTVYGEEHQEIARTLLSLGRVQENRGSFVEAEQTYRHALDLSRRTIGEADSLSIALRIRIADAQSGQSRYAAAESTLVQTVATIRNLGGEFDRRLPQALQRLGIVYRTTGDSIRARYYLEEALERTRAIHGESSTHTASALAQLGLFHYYQQRPVEAEGYLKEALRIYREFVGENHPWIPAVMNDLAMTYAALGKYAEADSTFRLTVDLNTRLLGENHHNTAVNLTNWAEMHLDLGDAARAEELIREALARLPHVLPADHWHVAYTERLLGYALLKQSRYAEAERYLVRSYTKFRDGLGPDHNRTRTTVNHLAELYAAWGKPTQAARYEHLLATK